MTLASDDQKIEALKANFKSKFTKLDNSFNKIQKESEAKNSEINLLKTKYKDLEKLVNEDQISNLEKKLNDKIAKINSLELRVEEMEKDHRMYKKQQEKKIKEILNSCKQNTKKEKESAQVDSKENIINCDMCDYTTTSRQGLKIHNSKVHSKKINFKDFPVGCDVCEKILDNESNLKKHKKEEHTYHYVKFQCNECDFMANEPQTLHVHFGKLHSVNKLCGLCDRNFKTSEQLDEHLLQCEIFVCSNSGCRENFKNPSFIREQIQKEYR